MLYDCFTFFNELDLLELRLHELAEVVDRFVIVEAGRTFQGDPKPLCFAEHQARFSAFADKIIHVVCEFPADIAGLYPGASIAWAREYYQRDQIARGISEARPDDLIIVGDVDEIISRERLEEALRVREPNEIVFFSMPLFKGAINRRVRDTRPQVGPRLVEYRHFTSAQKIRSLRLYSSHRLYKLGLASWPTRLKNYRHEGMANPLREIPHAGWHFSSIGTLQRVREKIEAFSHEEQREWTIFQNPDAYSNYLTANTEEIPIGDLPIYVQRNKAIFFP